MLFDNFGGPAQLLRAVLGSAQENAQPFAGYLDELVNREHGSGFWDRATALESGKVALISPADLAFHTQSSIKPPTFRKVAMQLLDEFILNGFITVHDPLRV